METNNDYNHEKTLLVYIDFQTKSLVEASNTVIRGIVLYLTLLVALSSYIFTQDITTDAKKALIMIGLFVSLLVLSSMGFIAWGVARGLLDLRHTMEILNPPAYHRASIGAFIRRGRIVMIVGMACCFVFFALLALIMVMLLLGYAPDFLSPNRSPG